MKSELNMTFFTHMLKGLGVRKDNTLKWTLTTPLSFHKLTTQLAIYVQVAVLNLSPLLYCWITNYSLGQQMSDHKGPCISSSSLFKVREDDNPIHRV